MSFDSATSTFSASYVDCGGSPSPDHRGLAVCSLSPNEEDYGGCTEEKSGDAQKEQLMEVGVEVLGRRVLFLVVLLFEMERQGVDLLLNDDPAARRSRDSYVRFEKDIYPIINSFLQVFIRHVQQVQCFVLATATGLIKTQIVYFFSRK